MLARRTIVLLSIALFAFLSGANGQGSGTGSKDLVNSLPGLRYPHTYQQYAGYLNTTDGTNAFYWYIHPQSARLRCLIKSDLNFQVHRIAKQHGNERSDHRLAQPVSRMQLPYRAHEGDRPIQNQYGWNDAVRECLLME